MGDVDEQNQIIFDLIDSKAMQRLKYIDQSGPQIYFLNNYPAFSRYDHSLGVYALLKRFSDSKEEQISGLLHDASHTVFSHVGDILFQAGDKRVDSYQDDIHDWFLANMQVDNILNQYNYNIKDVSPKNPYFNALEQPYPDMNADRIEYNLHTGLTFNDLNHTDVAEILNHLEFKDRKWYFTDITTAKKFAKLSTYYTKTLWSASQNAAFYLVTSALLKYCLQENIITRDDVHFGMDKAIIDKITAKGDLIVKEFMHILHNLDAYYISATDKCDIFVPLKMRGIDPLVLNNGTLHRLSELSVDFKNELSITQAIVNKGVKLNFVNIKNSYIKKLLTQSTS